MSSYGDVPPPPSGPPSGPPAGPPAGPPPGSPSGPPPGPPSGPPSFPPPSGPPTQGERAGRGWIAALVVGLVALVAVVVVLVVLLTGDDDDSDAGKGGTDEEQVEQVVTEAMTRWARAEAGDESACEGINDLIDGGDKDAEEQCRSEAGSNEGEELPTVEITDVTVDGDKGTAKVSYVGADDESAGFEREVNVAKSDGSWKVVVD